jgi:release factor glutamine methyltransferase
MSDDTARGGGERVVAAYQSGRRRFMGLDLHVAPGALVPRDETELLGATALRELRALGADERALTVVDMCCGSGNLACGLAAALPRLTVVACDLTDGCVAVARRNVADLGLSERVRVLQGDLFAPLSGQGLEGKVDAVVCNPPYISTGKLASDSAGLLDHEPREAFDGGAYGISIHQRVIREALPFLGPGAPLLFEFGAGQGRQLGALFARARDYRGFALVEDAQGEPRVALAFRGGEVA